MSLTLKDVALPADWVAKYGRKDAWYGDTHTSSGEPVERDRALPMLMCAQWSPPAAQADDPVEELHITYTDGKVEKFPASEFVVAK